MIIRHLTPADASAFQALRLKALQEAPTAFGSGYEEEKDFSPSVVESRLAAKSDCGVFGAFEDKKLLGFVALGRENRQKLSHKALIWGMYVSPDSRSKGIGQALLLEALSLARSVPDVLQVNLSVNADNVAAVRIYESLGFVTYGRESGAMLIDGELHDEFHMCLRIKRE